MAFNFVLPEIFPSSKDFAAFFARVSNMFCFAGCGIFLLGSIVPDEPLRHSDQLEIRILEALYCYLDRTIRLHWRGTVILHASVEYLMLNSDFPFHGIRSKKIPAENHT
jgi:hypothetical protein